MASRTVCTVCGREVGAVLNWEKRQAGRLVGEYRVARHVYDPHSRKTGNRAMCPGGGILIDARQLTEPLDAELAAYVAGANASYREAQDRRAGRPPPGQVETVTRGGLAGEFPNS